MTVVTICAPLSADPTARIIDAARRAGGTATVRYVPELMPPQRFPADHAGDPGWHRPARAERQWRDLLAGTEVALGIPGDSPPGLRALTAAADRLTWVQGTAAGAGEQLRRAALPPDIAARLTVTSAAGIHARPLAEFALFGLLAFAKDIDLLRRGQDEAHWRSRWPMRQLGRGHVLVVGLGEIGREVARLCDAFGAQVTGVRRRPAGYVPGVARIVGIESLDDVLGSCDAVVVTLPGTPRTERLFDADRLALLPPHAVLVNVGRGSVVDGDALVAALAAGRLRGAALDVTDPEPLPPTSALWRRPDVIVSPHTAALTADEDDRIVALFADNLERWLTGRTLRNVVDPNAGY
jgi:glyoxylate/hydroxypyruvate reductase